MRRRKDKTYAFFLGRRMEWKDKPDGPGWYWMKNTYNGVITIVELDSNGSVFWHGCGGYDKIEDSKFGRFLWQGPLVPPE